MANPYKRGLMDAVYLRQELDGLGIENTRRPAGAPRDDLLQTAAELQQCADEVGVAELLAGAHMRRADILLSLQRYTDAIAALLDARTALGSLRQYDLLVFILAKQAQAYSALDDWSNVSQICQEGIGLVETFRYKVTAQYQQSAYLRFRIALYTLGVRAAIELGQDELALERAELAKCRSVLRYRQQAGPTSVPGSEDTEAEFRKTCEQIDAAQRAQGRVSEVLLNRRRALWDILSIQKFQSRGSADVPEFSLAAVQAALGPNDAVLYYFWVDPAQLLICALNRDNISLELRPVSAASKQALEDFARTALQTGNGDVRDFAPLLLPREGLLRGKDRVFISPHRLLHAIPFHALPCGDSFLIEKLAVAYVPNLSALLLNNPPRRPPRVLALGISEYEVKGVSLGPLKNAEEEVVALKSTYSGKGVPIDCFMGSQAREECLQKLEDTLDQYTCLHFATHGWNVESDTPIESYLFLKDSKLEALEIANWKLRADLVVLSACCSGQRAISGRGMTELPGDDLLGLQAAFFAAGAQRILCSLWPVNDKAARIVMTSVHAFLAGGMLPEYALQAALKQYLKEAGMLHRSLSYWAPFFIASIGRPSSKEDYGEHHAAV